MGDEIQHRAQELKRSILEDSSVGIRKLIVFFEDFSVDEQVLNMALILQADLNFADKPDVKKKIQEELFGVIDQVVEEYDGTGPLPRLVPEQVRAIEKPNDLILSAREIGKKYPKSGFTLSEISISLRLGEITGVVGQNAQGKTTLLRIAAGDLAHDFGDLDYPGFLPVPFHRPADWAMVKPYVSYVPQNLPSLAGSMRDNLYYEASLHGLKGRENMEAVEQIIHRLWLQDHMEKTWDQLSGGFKLRFFLAKALVWKPRLLVIDEPLAHLDIKAQQVVLNDLRNLANGIRYPLSILISSQHLHEIEAVSDYILFLRDGKPEFYDRTEYIGKDSEENIYEFSTTLPRASLVEKLAGFNYSKMEETGLSYVLRSPIHVTHQDLLRHLLDHQVPVVAFRDISKSTKRLFV